MKGFKLYFEVLEPAEMKNKAGEMVKTKGEIIEHVFWITQKNLAYMKRDIAEGRLEGEILIHTRDPMAYEGEMPKAEFQALCRKYGTIIFEALLQQGTARPVVCPHCNEPFEVLIRDTSALKALMEQGFGKAHQTKTTIVMNTQRVFKSSRLGRNQV